MNLRGSSTTPLVQFKLDRVVAIVHTFATLCVAPAFHTPAFRALRSRPSAFRGRARSCFFLFSLVRIALSARERGWQCTRPLHVAWRMVPRAPHHAAPRPTTPRVADVGDIVVPKGPRASDRSRDPNNELRRHDQLLAVRRETRRRLGSGTPPRLHSGGA